MQGWCSSAVQTIAWTRALCAPCTADQYHPGPGLPPSMRALPGGFDLRLCRLAMMGFALAWKRGPAPISSLLEEEGSGSGTVLLVANLPQLAAWQQQQQGTDVGPLPAGARPVLTDVEFAAVEEAVLALQYWAWRLEQWQGAGARRWSLEHVCCRHLCEGGAAETKASAAGAAAEDCSWAAGLQAGQLVLAAKLGGTDRQQLAAFCCQVQEAAAAAADYLSGLRERYSPVVQGWLAMGAVY